MARVMREDPGWAVQTIRRVTLVKAAGGDMPNANVSRLLEAYGRGLAAWRDSSGRNTTFFDNGLSLLPLDLNEAKAIPSWKSPEGAPAWPPFVDTDNSVPFGKRVTLAPMKVADDLLCGITFNVIAPSPDNAKAAGIDYLGAAVEFFAGEKFQPKTTPLIGSDTTQVDFWNSAKHQRFTITRWRLQSPVGHTTVNVYGPLLFDTIDSEPDFLFIEDRKFTLPPDFRAGCRMLCDEVLKIRKQQGSLGRPRCRDL